MAIGRISQIFDDFASASEEARTLARLYDEPVGVERLGSGWVILVSEELLEQLTDTDMHDAPDDDLAYREAMEEFAYRRAKAREDEELERWRTHYRDHDIEADREWREQHLPDPEDEASRDEYQSDCDDFARSEEDGWYYEE